MTIDLIIIIGEDIITVGIGVTDTTTIEVTDTIAGITIEEDIAIIIEIVESISMILGIMTTDLIIIMGADIIMVGIGVTDTTIIEVTDTMADVTIEEDIANIILMGITGIILMGIMVVVTTKVKSSYIDFA